MAVEGNPGMDQHPIYGAGGGGGANQRRNWLDGLLGLNADFAI